MLDGVQPARTPRIEFLGCPIDNCTLDEAVALLRTAMLRRECLQHADVNVAKLLSMQTDAHLAQCVAESSLICADGMGIVWGARLLGFRIRQRVTGIDLMLSVLALCEREGFRPFFLGSDQETLTRAVAEVKRRHPPIEFAGYHHGYFRPEEEHEVVAAI